MSTVANLFMIIVVLETENRKFLLTMKMSIFGLLRF